MKPRYLQGSVWGGGGVGRNGKISQICSLRKWVEGMTREAMHAYVSHKQFRVIIGSRRQRSMITETKDRSKPFNYPITLQNHQTSSDTQLEESHDTYIHTYFLSFYHFSSTATHRDKISETKQLILHASRRDMQAHCGDRYRHAHKRTRAGGPFHYAFGQSVKIRERQKVVLEIIPVSTISIFF